MYPPPAYVTGELVFGDPNVEVNFMWVRQELTSEEVIAKENALTMINLKISDEGILQGIQFVYKNSVESPMFTAQNSRRMLENNNVSTKTEACVDECISQRYDELIELTQKTEECKLSCDNSSSGSLNSKTISKS